MEWSVNDSGPRFTVSFLDNDGKLKPSKLVTDNIENSIPDISVS